jgi:hypothetical protein
VFLNSCAVFLLFSAVPPEPPAPNEPPDIDDLDAMVSSLDQFASGADDDKIDILSKDDPPPRTNSTWVAGQSKPIASKPRSSAISHGNSVASSASPTLTRTSRVASNLSNSSSNNNAPPSSTPPTSSPAPPPTRSVSQQDTSAQQKQPNTLVKLSSKIFQNRASSGQAPTPVTAASSNSSATTASAAPSSGGSSGGDNVSPRLLSPRAPADTSTARPLVAIGKPEPDETLLATADRYRKMSCAISDLTKKQHQQMQNIDQHAQLVAKVLQKAEKQGLTPATISSQTAAVVQRLSTLNVATTESTARAYDGMGKTVDTIDSVRASLRQQHVEREQFDSKIAKYLKDKEKSKKANELPEVERALKAERERLDEQFLACDSTLREVYERKEDITAGFITLMLEAMLTQARAQAAMIPELERLAQASRGSMASGDERRRMASVYQEADDSLAAAGSASGVTDQQTVLIADARGSLIRDRGSRVATLTRNAAAGKPVGPPEAGAQQALMHVLVSHDLAALNAMCVTGRNSESALLEHVCNALDGHGLLLSTIEQGVSKVVATSEHEQTLFRSNTETTKLIGAFTKLHGLAYLQNLLQPVIERLKQANEDYEINPTGGATLSDDAVAANSARLRTLTTQFFTALTASSELVPPPLRAIAAHLHKEVAKKYPEAARSAVGGYICLRFVCPAMMTPRAFGVVSVDPPARAARALTLVSKIVQNVANGLEFKKEAFMMPFNDFVLANQASMNAFIDKVIAVPKAKVDATAPLATKDQALQRDIPALHYFMANNVGKMVKTMCDYKQYDAIAPFAAAVADAGTAPTNKPATLT